MPVKKFIDFDFALANCLKLNEYVRFYSDCSPYLDTYFMETYYGLSTREITLYHELATDSWFGNIIRFGEWEELEWYEVEQVKLFLKEKGYLSNEGCNINDTQQPVGQ